MTTRRWVLVGVLVAVLPAWWVVGAVGRSLSRPHAQEGVVIAKAHDDQILYYVLPIEICSGGDPPLCSEVPGHFNIIPESWSLRVRNAQRAEDWHNVDEKVFNACQVGMYWPGEDGVCR